MSGTNAFPGGWFGLERRADVMSGNIYEYRPAQTGTVCESRFLPADRRVLQTFVGFRRLVKGAWPPASAHEDKNRLGQELGGIALGAARGAWDSSKFGRRPRCA